MINATKLHSELLAAGISISGCNSNGIVWDESGKEIHGKKEVKDALTAHDPAPAIVESTEQRIKKLEDELKVMKEKK